MCHHIAKAFYPPARASNPQAPVYMNLQPPRHTARTSLHGRWALTPPSHPYLQAGGYFLLRYSALANSFLLGSGALCAARTFLLCLLRQRRQTVRLSFIYLSLPAKQAFCAAKVRQNRVINKCICGVLFYRFLVYENVLTLINV